MLVIHIYILYTSAPPNALLWNHFRLHSETCPITDAVILHEYDQSALTQADRNLRLFAYEYET